MIEPSASLVHVRTPTYNRPEALKRAIGSLLAQTWANWVCGVHHIPAGAGMAAVEAVADPHIPYNPNAPQGFAFKNMDQCVTAASPRARSRLETTPPAPANSAQARRVASA